MALYHGGVPGLEAGSILKARSALREWRGIGVNWGGYSSRQFGDDGQYVHLTTDLDVARSYASEYTSPRAERLPGTIYRVEAIGTDVEDPDYWRFPSTFRRAPAAKVVDVVEEGVFWTNPRMNARAMAQYKVWQDDGSPLYDEHGFLRLRPQMIAAGATVVAARKLGPWVPSYVFAWDLSVKPDQELPPLL